MQHKRAIPNTAILKLAAILIVGVALVALLVINVPAPQKPVEKELDAKAFLEPKQ